MAGWIDGLGQSSAYWGITNSLYEIVCIALMLLMDGDVDVDDGDDDNT